MITFLLCSFSFSLGLYISQWFSGETEPIEWMYIIKGEFIRLSHTIGVRWSNNGYQHARGAGDPGTHSAHKAAWPSSSELALNLKVPWKAAGIQGILESWGSWSLTSVERLWKLTDTATRKKWLKADRNILLSLRPPCRVICGKMLPIEGRYVPYLS